MGARPSTEQGSSSNKKQPVQYRDWNRWSKRHRLRFEHGTPLYFLKYYIDENRHGYEDDQYAEDDRRKAASPRGPDDIWSGPKSRIHVMTDGVNGAPRVKKPRNNNSATMPNQNKQGVEMRSKDQTQLNGYATSPARHSFPAGSVGGLERGATFKSAMELNDQRYASNFELWSAEYPGTAKELHRTNSEQMNTGIQYTRSSSLEDPHGANSRLMVHVDQPPSPLYPSPTASSSSEDPAVLYATIDRPHAPASFPNNNNTETGETDTGSEMSSTASGRHVTNLQL